MNAINIIYPHKVYNTWCFTDESVGLREEPFIGDTNSVIDSFTHSLDNPEKGFKLIFSGEPFPEYDYIVEHLSKDEASGNWYKVVGRNTPFWLCNALMKYFDQAPKEIYVKVEQLNS